MIHSEKLPDQPIRVGTRFRATILTRGRPGAIANRSSPSATGLRVGRCEDRPDLRAA